MRGQLNIKKKEPLILVYKRPDHFDTWMFLLIYGHQHINYD